MSSPVQTVLARLKGVKRSGDGWLARCPAHDDRNPSLSIGEGGDGRVLLNCHAGCQPGAVVKAIDLDLSDLFPDSGGDGARPEIIATYDYEDEEGAPLFQKVRYFPKRFSLRRPDGSGG